jgi:hypothetical protein
VSTWRYRRCPSCSVVLNAGEFTCLTYGSNWRDGSDVKRQCPDCGFVGTTDRFYVVREKHAAAPVAAAVEVDHKPTSVSERMGAIASDYAAFMARKAS